MLHGDGLRHALVANGDEASRTEMAAYLRAHGLEVAEAGDLAGARALLGRHRFDVAVVHAVLTGGDGLDLLREVADSRYPPVVMTGVAGDEADRLLALEFGADDYLTPPFSLRELLARLKAVHRRAGSTAARLPRPRVARFDRWRLNLASHVLVSDDGAEARLTAGELGVLRALLEHPHQVVRRQDFLAFTRHDDAEVFERAIDVLVTRIRRKIEIDPRHPSCLQTVRGEGYQLTCDVQWTVADPA